MLRGCDAGQPRDVAQSVSQGRLHIGERTRNLTAQQEAFDAVFDEQVAQRGGQDAPDRCERLAGPGIPFAGHAAQVGHRQRRVRMSRKLAVDAQESPFRGIVLQNAVAVGKVEDHHLRAARRVAQHPPVTAQGEAQPRPERHERRSAVSGGVAPGDLPGQRGVHVLHEAYLRIGGNAGHRIQHTAQVDTADAMELVRHAGDAGRIVERSGNGDTDAGKLHAPLRSEGRAPGHRSGQGAFDLRARALRTDRTTELRSGQEPPGGIRHGRFEERPPDIEQQAAAILCQTHL